MFKERFKYYKSRKPPPNIEDVLDFNMLQEHHLKNVRSIEIEKKSEACGLIPIKDWKIYELACNPGLVFIRNPFTELGQLYWVIRCLQDYTKKPNKSNLDAHNIIQDNEDWWSKSKEEGSLLKKLRWMTLGYHHNWDTKVYDENIKNQFPADLSDLCRFIAAALNFENFQPEAAIVNYYHMDSILSGHTDHSEQNLEAPLLSFSFGQTALFLLGGQSMDVAPTAMYLQSGDIVIMSKESRLCYHGVPKILPSKCKPWKAQKSENNVRETFYNCIGAKIYDKLYTEPFESYLEQCRININVRQVLKHGQQMLLHK